MGLCLGPHIYECHTVQLGSCGCSWPLTVALIHAQQWASLGDRGLEELSKWKAGEGGNTGLEKGPCGLGKGERR